MCNEALDTAGVCQGRPQVTTMNVRSDLDQNCFRLNERGRLGHKLTVGMQSCRLTLVWGGTQDNLDEER